MKSSLDRTERSTGVLYKSSVKKGSREMDGGWKVRESSFMQVSCLGAQGNEQRERENFMMQKREGALLRCKASEWG